MNKEYVEVDGNLIISDENGHLRIEPASDLSKEILKQQNIRSQELKDLECYADQKVNYDNFKGKYRPFWLYTATAATLIAPPLTLLMAGINPMAETFETIFGTINLNLFVTGLTGAFAIPMASLMTYFDYQNFKVYRERWKYADGQYEVHQKGFSEADRKLKELLDKSDKEEKPKTYTKEYRIQKVEE